MDVSRKDIEDIPKIEKDITEIEKDITEVEKDIPKIEKVIPEIEKVIPGGAHTYSKGNDQFPINCPQLFEKGYKCYLYDQNGNKLLDYGMGLRSVTVGYSREEINAGAINGMLKGNNLTKASTMELEAAKLFVKTVGTEMVKFAKNGSNVTTAAVKLARAYNNKRYVVRCNQPFFSFDDWFIGTTTVSKGVPCEHYKYTKCFNYNDIESLEKLFEEHRDDICSVIMEPVTKDLPKQYEDGTNFLTRVRDLCDKNNTVLIFDEMITGFRYGMKGAGAEFGVTADLLTFGKGIANGFSIAALTGKREIMDLGNIHTPGHERVFLLSSTHGAEMSSLGALIETIKMYTDHNIIDHIWKYGEQLITTVNQISKDKGVYDYIRLEGLVCSPTIVTNNKDREPCFKFRTLFMQEMIKNGVLMPYIAVSYSHKEDEFDITVSAFAKTIDVYRSALETDINNYLIGRPIKPVFRKYN